MGTRPSDAGVHRRVIRANLRERRISAVAETGEGEGDIDCGEVGGLANHYDVVTRPHIA
jgi:hypothetical protein